MDILGSPVHMPWQLPKTITNTSIFHFFVVAAEHIRNWRPRYFILKDNGQFIGFRNKPSQVTDLNDPLNNFTVKNCQIIKANRPRPFTFYIRGLHLYTVVERIFCVDTEEDRYVWKHFMSILIKFDKNTQCLEIIFAREIFQHIQILNLDGFPNQAWSSK